MALLPGYTYTQHVSVVTNTATAINSEIAAQQASGYVVTQLTDKPTTNEVYLLFAKNEPIVAP